MRVIGAGGEGKGRRERKRRGEKNGVEEVSPWIQTALNSSSVPYYITYWSCISVEFLLLWQITTKATFRRVYLVLWFHSGNSPSWQGVRTAGCSPRGKNTWEFLSLNFKERANSHSLIPVTHLLQQGLPPNRATHWVVAKTMGEIQTTTTWEWGTWILLLLPFTDPILFSGEKKVDVLQPWKINTSETTGLLRSVNFWS